MRMKVVVVALVFLATAAPVGSEAATSTVGECIQLSRIRAELTQKLWVIQDSVRLKCLKPIKTCRLHGRACVHGELGEHCGQAVVDCQRAVQCETSGNE